MYFIKLDELPKKNLLAGTEVRFVNSRNMTIAHWNFNANARLPEHSHLHEQVTNIIQGEFELTVNGQTKILEPGSVAVIPPGAVHSGKAVTDCYCIDAFYPVREDYR
ncbi:MAG TPA: cupin domain-containing protein [archaeon]|nr:cupin domain-containing protein [archaeon]